MIGRSFALYTALVVVGIVAVSAALWVLIFISLGDGPKTSRVEMLLEVSKIVVQFALVTVLGGTVTFLYNTYAKEQEQRKLQIQEDNKLRRELLESLIGVRAQVEKARREFRLLSPSERKVGYDKAIQSLLEARLRVSHIWHDTETWKGLYSSHGPEIQQRLLDMKSYLDQLIGEYEQLKVKDIQKADDQGWPQLVSDCPQFNMFITNDGGEAYTKGFLENNYRKAAQLIRQYILMPSPPEAPPPA
jgi:hypothetical protein